MLFTKKESCLEIGPYKGVYGYIKKRKSSVLYIRMKTKVIPYGEEDYSFFPPLLRIAFGKKLYKVVEKNNNLGKDIIYQLSTNEKGMKQNKPSFLKFDIFLKPLETLSLSDYGSLAANVAGIVIQEITHILTTHKIEYA